MKRGFNLFITRCIDCPYKAYSSLRCTKADREFNLLTIDKKIAPWCPMAWEEQDTSEEQDAP